MLVAGNHTPLYSNLLWKLWAAHSSWGCTDNFYVVFHLAVLDNRGYAIFHEICESFFQPHSWRSGIWIQGTILSINFLVNFDDNLHPTSLCGIFCEQNGEWFFLTGPESWGILGYLGVTLKTAVIIKPIGLWCPHRWFFHIFRVPSGPVADGFPSFGKCGWYPLVI